MRRPVQRCTSLWADGRYFVQIPPIPANLLVFFFLFFYNGAKKKAADAPASAGSVKKPPYGRRGCASSHIPPKHEGPSYAFFAERF